MEMAASSVRRNIEKDTCSKRLFCIFLKWCWLSVGHFVIACDCRFSSMQQFTRNYQLRELIPVPNDVDSNEWLASQGRQMSMQFILVCLVTIRVKMSEPKFDRLKDVMQCSSVFF